MAKNRQIKVAFCIPNMIIGGVETVFVNTIDELLKNPDLDITIITHAKIREPLYVDWLKSHPELPVYVYYPLCNWFEDLGQKCCRILRPIRRIMFSLYKKYRRLIWRHKFQDIDVFVDYKNFEFFKELRHINKPKIAWAHSSLSYFESDGMFSRLPQYTKIVGITDEFVSDFKSNYPEYADKIVRIYNPIDVKTIQAKAKSEKSPRGKYFCHVSRLVDGKDIKTLLDGFDLFAASHKNIKLYIVGDGDKAQEFKEYAKTLASNKQIVFTGALNNPYGIIKGAIANVLSSEFEGLATVLLEAIALHVPCISANCKCGPKEVLLNGRAGLIFDVGDAETLAKHMNYIYENPKKAQKLTDAATRGLKRFDKSLITDAICHLVKQTSQKDR